MDDRAYGEIKKEYDLFYNGLLRSGKLPMWGTQKGFWNASITEEVYSAFKKARLDKFSSFLDIGSGDGKIVLLASLFCRNAEGVEIDGFLHGIALRLQEKLGIKNAKFHNKDFFAHDFSKYDVLFLSPDAPMERGVEKKLLNEMRGRLIHYGNHFHPKLLKLESRFSVNNTLVGVYSNKKSITNL
ncbi:MAG TPA: hypothetical protein VJI46_03230 [Candidatus Nanoarchaeia archaeon]|nr:hypothetical protein [Candidatus Nanoarchaeia archaeon]